MSNRKVGGLSVCGLIAAFVAVTLLHERIEGNEPKASENDRKLSEIEKRIDALDAEVGTGEPGYSNDMQLSRLDRLEENARQSELRVQMLQQRLHYLQSEQSQYRKY